MEVAGEESIGESALFFFCNKLLLDMIMDKRKSRSLWPALSG